VTTPLWVVVPAYNEAARIGDTLAALARQTDTDFTLLVVDNGSTDATAELARAFRGPFPTEVLVEPEKGVGCAVDTGFRHAIAAGAVHLARTDADCLPAPGWVAAARRALVQGCAATGTWSFGRRGEPGRCAATGTWSFGRRGEPGR
jgi:glycosyltransferase involved in cell wall biosynthesis